MYETLDSRVALSFILLQMSVVNIKFQFLLLEAFGGALMVQAYSIASGRALNMTLKCICRIGRSSYTEFADA